MPKAFAFLALDARREAPGYAEAIAERAQVRGYRLSRVLFPLTPTLSPPPRRRAKRGSGAAIFKVFALAARCARQRESGRGSALSSSHAPKSRRLKR